MALSCFQFKSSGTALETLLAHLPKGVAWLAFRISGKVASRLYAAFAKIYEGATESLCRLFTEIDFRTAVGLIPEWEEALSLPDSCLPASSDLEGRRRNIRFRLDKRRWSTAQDWKDLAELFGFEIAITPGWYVQRPALFEARFPMRFDLFPKLGRFRVYIDVMNVSFTGFEYGSDGTNESVGFPIPFGDFDKEIDAFKCIIDRVKPANVIVIWNEFPGTDERSCTRETFDNETFDTQFC